MNNPQHLCDQSDFLKSLTAQILMKKIFLHSLSQTRSEHVPALPLRQCKWQHHDIYITYGHYSRAKKTDKTCPKNTADLKQKRFHDSRRQGPADVSTVDRRPTKTLFDW